MNKYFNLSNAWDEVSSRTGTDKATAVAKLIGKGASNTVVFGVTEFIPALFKTAATSNVQRARKALKSDDLSSEQRERCEKALQASQAYLDHAQQAGRSFETLGQRFKDDRAAIEDPADDSSFNDDPPHQRLQR